MSRSYKKFPCYKCAGDKTNKKTFNRKLRRTTGIEDIPSGNAYRKMNESWDINDFVCYCTWENYKGWECHKNDNEQELYIEWKRTFYSK